MASGDQDGRKYTYIRALYLLGGIIAFVGIVMVIVFCTVRLLPYLDSKDYEEGMCVTENIYWYVGEDETDPYKIWCSCHDIDKPPPCVEPAVRTSGSYHLPCWRLNVTVNSTGISTWLRTTYHVKGYDCTNNCELGFRTDAHLNATFVKETGFPCWYHPTDTAAQAVLEKPSTAWIIHSLVWPSLMVVLGLALVAAGCMVHAKMRRSGSQSYA